MPAPLSLRIEDQYTAKRTRGLSQQIAADGVCISVHSAQRIDRGDFQERCHSWAAFQAACINGSCPGSLSSSGALVPADCPVSIRLMCGVNLTDRSKQLFCGLLTRENAVGMAIVTRLSRRVNQVVALAIRRQQKLVQRR